MTAGFLFFFYVESYHKTIINIFFISLYSKNVIILLVCCIVNDFSLRRLQSPIPTAPYLFFQQCFSFPFFFNVYTEILPFKHYFTLSFVRLVPNRRYPRIVPESTHLFIHLFIHYYILFYYSSVQLQTNSVLWILAE